MSFESDTKITSTDGSVFDQDINSSEGDDQEGSNQPQGAHSYTPGRRLRNRGKKPTAVVPIESSVKRNILILGKNGEGKSTLGNKILNFSRFKMSSTDLLKTSTGSSAVNSETRYQSFVLKVYDHNGLFDTEIAAAMPSLFCAEDELVVNLVLFVIKQGHGFDEGQQQTLNTIMRRWDISIISALVITHCERLSKKEQITVRNQFKEKYPDVIKFMKCGVFTVGFPDQRYVRKSLQLIESIESDVSSIRQLIYSSERTVKLSRLRHRSIELGQKQESKCLQSAVKAKQPLSSRKDTTLPPAPTSSQIPRKIQSSSSKYITGSLFKKSIHSEVFISKKDGHDSPDEGIQRPAFLSLSRDQVKGETHKQKLLCIPSKTEQILHSPDRFSRPDPASKLNEQQKSDKSSQQHKGQPAPSVSEKLSHSQQSGSGFKLSKGRSVQDLTKAFEPQLQDSSGKRGQRSKVNNAQCHITSNDRAVIAHTQLPSSEDSRLKLSRPSTPSASSPSSTSNSKLLTPYAAGQISHHSYSSSRPECQQSHKSSTVKCDLSSLQQPKPCSRTSTTKKASPQRQQSGSGLSKGRSVQDLTKVFEPQLQDSSGKHGQRSKVRAVIVHTSPSSEDSRLKQSRPSTCTPGPSASSLSTSTSNSKLQLSPRRRTPHNLPLSRSGWQQNSKRSPTTATKHGLSNYNPKQSKLVSGTKNTITKEALPNSQQSGSGLSTGRSVQDLTKVFEDINSSDFDQFEVKDHHLSLIEWKDSSGSDNTAKVKIYDRAEDKWYKIAECLGLNPNKIGSIRQNNHERVIEVFREWLDNANQLPNKEKYPLKWSGLIKLLKDSRLGQLAMKLESALKASRNNVKENL